MSQDKSVTEQTQDDFSSVDQSGQAYRYLQYLEKQRNDVDIQRIKRQSYALLEVVFGKQLLDVGCGIGDDVRYLANLVGRSGKVVGVDNSQTMLEFARQFTKQSEGTTEYILGDAHNLAFPDAIFDGCRAERILQHCHTPEMVLKEMIRVVKPGGVVVAIDVDHDTFVTNLINHELSRKFTKANCDQIRNGWVGRRLPGLFNSYGLTDICVLPTAICKTKCDLEDISGMLNGALSDNLLTQEEVNEIIQEIRDLDRCGQYCEAGIIFTVVGHKKV